MFCSVPLFIYYASYSIESIVYSKLSTFIIDLLFVSGVLLVGGPIKHTQPSFLFISSVRYFYKSTPSLCM